MVVGGFLIGWLVFLVAGAAIVGVWETQPNASYTCGDYEDDWGNLYSSCQDGGKTPLFYAGVACLAIAGVLHLAYWIALIIWCTRRRNVRRENFRASNTYDMLESGFNQPSNYGPYQPVSEYPVQQQMKTFSEYPAQQPVQQPMAPVSEHPIEQPAEQVSEYPVQQPMGRHCGNCGAVTTGKFCQGCGSPA